MFIIEKTISSAHDDTVNNIKWTPQNQILTAGLDGVIKLWNSEHDYELIGSFSPSHPLGIVNMDLETSGTFLCSNSIEGSSVNIYDVKERKLHCKIPCSPIESWALCWIPFQNLVVTGAMNGILHFWNTEEKTKSHTLEFIPKFIYCMASSSDGKLLAVGYEHGAVLLIDVQSKKLLTTYSDHTKSARVVLFSNDNKVLFTASEDQKINIYNLDSGNLITTLYGHSSWILSLSVHPNGLQLASSSMDKKIKIWDLVKYECLYTMDTASEEVFGLSYSPNGKFLASVGSDKSLTIYKVIF